MTERRGGWRRRACQLARALDLVAIAVLSAAGGAAYGLLVLWLVLLLLSR